MTTDEHKEAHARNRNGDGEPIHESDRPERAFSSPNGDGQGDDPLTKVEAASKARGDRQAKGSPEPSNGDGQGDAPRPA
jgi:hypothetical protein